MKGFDLLQETHWKPLAHFGYTHPFFSINAETVVYTWIIIALLLILVAPIHWLLKKNGKAAYIICSSVDYFKVLSEQTLGFFSFKHFSFVTTLFLFIFSCNAFASLPGLEEPTQDINTTLALGLASFLYIQWYTIKVHGIGAYIKEYFDPFFLMFPLNVVGKLASVVSLSFRLFGNVFGGAIIAKIFANALNGSWIAHTFALVTGLNLTITLFFGIFEGFLQAFVFTMLTLTYLSIAIKQENESDTQKAL